MVARLSLAEMKKALRPLWAAGNAKLIVLFGSIASGHERPDSDLDIGILPIGELDEIDTTAAIVRRTHRNDVDLVDLRRADPVLARRIAQTGKVLFSDEPSRFAEFRSLAFRRFVDTEKLRDAQRRALDRFEREGAMSPVEPSLVERNLGQISERLTILGRYKKEGWAKYRSNFERRKTTEKLLQELIEAAIDINTHILVELTGTVPQDYYESFTKMGAKGWMSEKLASKLAPSAGLRNRLVHQYSAIDDRKIFDAIQSALALFGEYLKVVRVGLKRKGKGKEKSR